MKTLLLLLFLTAGAMGQDLQYDGTGKPPSGIIGIGNPDSLHQVDEYKILVQPVIRGAQEKDWRYPTLRLFVYLYRQYAKECYNDSMVVDMFGGYATLVALDSLGNVQLRKNQYWGHKAITLSGFMEWLEKRMKEK